MTLSKQVLEFDFALLKIFFIQENLNPEKFQQVNNLFQANLFLFPPGFDAYER